MNLLTNNKRNLFGEVKNSLKITDVTIRLGSHLKQQNRTILVGHVQPGTHPKVKPH